MVVIRVGAVLCGGYGTVASWVVKWVVLGGLGVALRCLIYGGVDGIVEVFIHGLVADRGPGRVRKGVSCESWVRWLI